MADGGLVSVRMLRMRHMDEAAPRAGPLSGASQRPVIDRIAHIGAGIVGLFNGKAGITQHLADAGRPGAVQRRRAIAGGLIVAVTALPPESTC